MAKKRRLLILGPSFRRNKIVDFLPAFERYDGLFFRIAKKYLPTIRNIDVVVMTDDLTLVDAFDLLPYQEPVGTSWVNRTVLKDTIEQAKTKNKDFFKKKLKTGRYEEVFISMGKEYAKALSTLDQYGVKVIFPSTGGLGPKAQALKNWLVKIGSTG